MDVQKLIDCLISGNLDEALKYAPKSYPETIELQLGLPVGWKFHGFGFYSVVIGEVDSAYAYKIVWRSGDQWVTYAKYAMGREDQNPLLPRIFALAEDDFRVIAKVERLYDSGIYHSVGMADVVKLVRNPLFSKRYRKPAKRLEKIRNYLWNQFDMRGNRNYNPTNLAEIVVWMAGNPVKVDCKGNNWMIRQTGQLVLTDPIG